MFFDAAEMRIVVVARILVAASAAVAAAAAAVAAAEEDMKQIQVQTLPAAFASATAAVRDYSALIPVHFELIQIMSSIRSDLTTSVRQINDHKWIQMRILWKTSKN